MYQLIKQPEDQLRILFRNTAQKTGLHEAIVERSVLPWTIFFTVALGRKHLHSRAGRASQNATV